ncbi:MAG: hypothetical protein ACERKO_09310 [Acetanaerobacterium sp.]
MSGQQNKEYTHIEMSGKQIRNMKEEVYGFGGLCGLKRIQSGNNRTRFMPFRSQQNKIFAQDETLIFPYNGDTFM